MTRALAIIIIGLIITVGVIIFLIDRPVTPGLRVAPSNDTTIKTNRDEWHPPSLEAESVTLGVRINPSNATKIQIYRGQWRGGSFDPELGAVWGHDLVKETDLSGKGPGPVTIYFSLPRGVYTIYTVLPPGATFYSAPITITLNSNITVTPVFVGQE